MIRTVLALALLPLAACSPQEQPQAQAAAQAATQPATHPVSGLQVIPLSVTSANGVHRFRVEVAATPEAQSRGLMFRTELGASEGMIFPSIPPAARSFWMQNTPLPLDIVFVGTDGRILNIAAMTTPYSQDPIPSSGVTSGVLELRGGRAAELGIAPGDKVAW